MEKKLVKSNRVQPTPDPKYHLEITADGPYLVYGNPPLQQEIFVLNKEQIPWEYTQGHKYPTDNEPTLYAVVVNPKIIRIATVPITMPIGIRH